MACSGLFTLLRWADFRTFGSPPLPLPTGTHRRPRSGGYPPTVCDSCVWPTHGPLQVVPPLVIRAHSPLSGSCASLPASCSRANLAQEAHHPLAGCTRGSPLRWRAGAARNSCLGPAWPSRPCCGCCWGWRAEGTCVPPASPPSPLSARSFRSKSRPRRSPCYPLFACAATMPCNKSFRVKKTLAKKLKQNRPIPQWIRMRTDNRIRYNAKRRHWRRTKIGL